MASSGMPLPYQRKHDSIKGRHLIATVDMNVGDLILSERPLLTLPSRENLVYNLPCHGCHAFVGGPDAYLQRRLDILRNEPTGSAENAENDSSSNEERGNTLYECIPCRAACGHVFCSAQCEDDTWRAHHAYLCTGDCATHEHKLVQFKQYATMTNEVLLLVAEWWVAQHTTRDAHEYTDFCMPPWWDVLTADQSQQPNDLGEATTVQDQLLNVCETAAAMLNEALLAKYETLSMHSVPVTRIPTIAPMDIACRIGAVEQNCMGVLQRSPLCRDVFDRSLRTRHHAAMVHCLRDANFLTNEMDEAQNGMEQEPRDRGDDTEYSVADVAQCLGGLYMNESHSAREAPTEEDDDVDVDNETDNDIDNDINQDVEDDESEPTSEPAQATGDDLDLVFPPLDCIAMYATICKMNHSCTPNVMILYPRHTGWGHALTAFGVATANIRAGEELTISYIDATASRSARQLALTNYGFHCQCPRCQAELNDEMNSVDPVEDMDDVNDIDEEIMSRDDLDVEIVLQRRLDRLDTIANTQCAVLPAHVYHAMAAYVVQTSRLICTNAQGLTSGSDIVNLLEQCVSGIQQRDYCLCHIVGCDLEATLGSLYHTSGAVWPSMSHREAYFCGALTACVGYSHAFQFVAAHRILDRALAWGLPAECVESAVHFIQLHSLHMRVGPYQT